MSSVPFDTKLGEPLIHSNSYFVQDESSMLTLAKNIQVYPNTSFLADEG